MVATNGLEGLAVGSERGHTLRFHEHEMTIVVAGEIDLTGR
jgi:hypothetical protein